MSMELAWNTQKNKITDVKGKEKEQERQGFIRNPEIDLEKTHLNYDLVISDLNLYQRVKKRVEEAREVSRIQKNSVVNYSNVITINQDQFEKWGIDKSKEYFNLVYKYFCDEFGKENVVSAKVHLDETTPHMHLHFVPVNKENGKLQARIVMDRKRINKIHTELPKYLQENNFNVVRGKGRTSEKNIKDIHEFKVKNIEKAEKELNSVKIDLEAHIRTLNKINDISRIKTSKTILGDNIKLKQYDYENIVQEYKNLLNENIILSKENENLKSENKNINKKLNNARNEIKSFNYAELNFEKKRKDLKEELIENIHQDYDEKINNLKDKVKDVYKLLNENNKTIKKLKEENKNLEFERDFEERAAEKLANFLRVKKMMKEYNEFHDQHYQNKTNKSKGFSM